MGFKGLFSALAQQPLVNILLNNVIQANFTWIFFTARF